MELIVKLVAGKYQWAVTGPEHTTVGDRETLAEAVKGAMHAWARQLRESKFGADLEAHPERVIVLYRDSGDYEDIRVFRDVDAFTEYAKDNTGWDTEDTEFHHALEALRAGETVVDRESVLFWTDLIEDGRQ